MTGASDGFEGVPASDRGPTSLAIPSEAEPLGTSGAVPDVGRALGSTLRASVAIQAINSISGIELARGLGVHNRGALAAAILWPMIAGLLGVLGLEQSITYFVARDPHRAGRLVGSGLVLCAVQSAGFWLLALAVIPLVLSKHGSSVVVSGLIYSLYVPLNMVAVTLTGVLNALHRYGWANLTRLTIGLGVIGAQTVLVALAVMSVRTVVVWSMVAYLANALFIIALVWRARPGRLGFDRATISELFGYGIRSHASTIPAALNQNLDQLLISAFLTTTQLGIYVIAVTMSSLTALVGGSVAYAALPNVASLRCEARRSLVAKRMVSLTLAVSAAISIAIILLTPLLIRLFFGASFDRSSGVARVLLVAAVALSTNRALEGVLRGIGRPLDAGIAEIIALGATVVGLAVLLPTLGLMGAALTSILAYLISLGWMTRRTTGALGLGARELLIPDRAATRELMSQLGRRLRSLAGSLQRRGGR